MLDIAAVDKIVDRAATASLGATRLNRVHSKPATDSDGQDALSVMLVIHSDKLHELTGDMALDVLVRIQHDLQNSGEQRFAFVEYATQEELDLEELDLDDSP